MSDPFRLTVPADSRFRALVPEVASRYVEVLGGSAAEGATLAAAVTAALDQLTLGARDGEPVQFAFRWNAGNVLVDLSLGGRAETVTCPLALKP